MRLMSYAAVAVVGISVFLSSVLQAADWPQWRGVNRDDLSSETELLRQLPEGGPVLLWKVSDIGTGYSGCSVVKGRLFIMGDQGGECLLMAMEAATGKKIWSLGIGNSGGHGGYDGPRGTPTVDGGGVYALNQHGDIFCVSIAAGKEVWKKSLTKDFGGGTPGWGYTESPLVDGDKVFLTPGGSRGAIVALDKKTGATIWQTEDFTDGAQYSSLIVEDVSGVRQVIQLTGQSVVGVSVTDGKVLWRAAREGKTAIVPTPVYSDNQVFVTSGYGVGCNAFKITKDGSGFSAEQIYANRDMINHHGGVILYKGYVYGHSDSKGWVCMNFKTGEVAWADKGVGKGAIAFADGHFYIRSESGAGTIALIEANPKEYVEKGRFNQPDRSDKNSWPHPVIVNGRLYIRDQGTLLCYNVKGK